MPELPPYPPPALSSYRPSPPSPLCEVALRSFALAGEAKQVTGAEFELEETGATIEHQLSVARPEDTGIRAIQAAVDACGEFAYDDGDASGTVSMSAMPVDGIGDAALHRVTRAVGVVGVATGASTGIPPTPPGRGPLHAGRMNDSHNPYPAPQGGVHANPAAGYPQGAYQQGGYPPGTGPSGPMPGPPPPKKPNTTLLVAAIAVLAVIAVGTIGFVVLGGDDDDSADGGAGGGEARTDLTLADLEPALLTAGDVPEGFESIPWEDDADDDELTSDQIDGTAECEQVLERFSMSDGSREETGAEFEAENGASIESTLSVAIPDDITVDEVREGINTCGTFSYDDGDTTGEITMSAEPVDGIGDSALFVTMVVATQAQGYDVSVEMNGILWDRSGVHSSVSFTGGFDDDAMSTSELHSLPIDQDALRSAAEAVDAKLEPIVA